MNYKGTVINNNAGERVTFESLHIDGPTNAPIWQSSILINDNIVFTSVNPGSKVESEQQTSKLYLEHCERIQENNINEEDDTSDRDEFLRNSSLQVICEQSKINQLLANNLNILHEYVKSLENRIIILESKN